MPNDITEIRRLGTCRINFTGVDMGYTLGGVTVMITTSWTDIFIDEYGEVPVDDIDIGTNIEATVPLAQPSLNNYEKAFNTGRRADGITDRLTFGRKVGTSITKGRLVLDPINDTDGVVLYNSGIVNVDDLGYNNDNIRILSCHFKGFIDDSRSGGDKLFRLFGGMS